MNKHINRLLIYILSCTGLLVVYLYSAIGSAELHQNTYNFSKKIGGNDNQSMQISIPIFERISKSRKYKTPGKKAEKIQITIIRQVLELTHARAILKILNQKEFLNLSMLLKPEQ